MLTNKKYFNKGCALIHKLSLLETINYTILKTCKIN